MEDLAVVAFGCLLHDIGKIVQRADETPLRQGHARFGADLLQSAGLLKESKFWYHIFECIRYHHFKYIKDGSLTLPAARIAFEASSLLNDTVFGAVQDTDGHSLEEIEAEKNWDRHRRLDSIFLLLLQQGNKETKASYPLAQIDGRKIALASCPVPEESTVEERAPECYSHLRDLAVSRVVAYLQGRDPRSIDLVNDVSAYLEQHLRFVPSECYSDRTCYLSLHDQIKLTAAIGSCIYAWLSEHHPEATTDLKAVPDSATLRTSPVYLLLFGELRGARDFILNSRDSSTTRLRNRSTYADLLTSWMSELILRALGLSRNNVLLRSGHRFSLLVPNTAHALGTLARMQVRLNEWFYENFGGRLFFALDCTEVSGADLQDTPAEKTPTRSLLRASREKLQKVSGEPFRGLLASVFTAKPPGTNCSVCGSDISPACNSNDATVCLNCAAANEVDSRTTDVGAMLDQPWTIKGTAGPGLFPIWNGDTARFQSGTLNAAPITDSICPAPVARSNRASNRKRDHIPYAVMRAKLVYPGGTVEAGASGSRRAFIKDLLVEETMEYFLKSCIDELLAEKDSRQFESVERVLSSPRELLLGGPADKLLDFAVQLQQRLYKFTSGAVTLSCAMNTCRKFSDQFVELSQRVEELECTVNTGMRVEFDTGGKRKAVVSLSWHDWRREVRPLMHDLHRLRARGAVGNSFWNQLLDYTLNGSLSFYRLLYSVARMDERSPDLRSDAIWQRFKRQRVMPLGSRAGDARSRSILAAALLWVELAAANLRGMSGERSHSPEEQGEPAARMHHNETTVQLSEQDSSRVGG
jgi:hypothetical protein